MSTVIETEDCDNIQIPSYVTFMTNRCKLINTPSGGISVAIRDNIFLNIKIMNTNLNLCLGLNFRQGVTKFP